MFWAEASKISTKPTFPTLLLSRMSVVTEDEIPLSLWEKSSFANSYWMSNSSSMEAKFDKSSSSKRIMRSCSYYPSSTRTSFLMLELLRFTFLLPVHLLRYLMSADGLSQFRPLKSYSGSDSKSFALRQSSPNFSLTCTTIVFWMYLLISSCIYTDYIAIWSSSLSWESKLSSVSSILKCKLSQRLSRISSLM